MTERKLREFKTSRQLLAEMLTGEAQYNHSNILRGVLLEALITHPDRSLNYILPHLGQAPILEPYVEEAGRQIVTAGIFDDFQQGWLAMAHKGLRIVELHEAKAWVQLYPNDVRKSKKINRRDVWPIIERLPDLLSAEK